MGQLIFMDESGDKAVVWDKNDPAQVQDARDKFEKWKGKGHQMYRITGSGKKRQQVPIDTFDPSAEEIIVIQTTKKG